MLAAILAIIQAAIPAPLMAAYPKHDSIAQQNNSTQGKNKPSSTALIPPPQQVFQPTTQLQSAKEKGKDGWDKAAVISNYLLVIAGFVGIAYAASTFGKLKEQTEAAKDAAAAALKQADHIVATERAWIVVTIESDPRGNVDGFLVKGVNKGNTPAEIIEMHCRCEGHRTDFQPPEDLGDPLPAPNQALIVSAADFPIRQFSWRHCAYEITGSENLCFLYGKILYWDAFTDRSAHRAFPHVTQWMFVYNGRDGFFRYASDYTKHT